MYKLGEVGVRSLLPPWDYVVRGPPEKATGTWV